MNRKVARALHEPSLEDLASFVSCAKPLELASFSAADQAWSLPRAVERGIHALAVLTRGEVERGVSMLVRSAQTAGGAYGAFLADLSLGMLVSRARVAEAARIVQMMAHPPRELQPSIVAARAVIAAFNGDRAASRKFFTQAYKSMQRLHMPVLRMRAASRLTLAAFHTGDVGRADDLSREVISVADQIGAYRPAAYAYSILASTATYHYQDDGLSQRYLERVIEYGAIANDSSLERYGHVFSCWQALVYGDLERFNALRQKLLNQPMAEQHGEGRTASLLDAISLELSGNFDAAVRVIDSTSSRLPAGYSGERALHEAVKAVCFLGGGNEAEARRLCREVIAATIRPKNMETVVERFDRTAGRLLAAITSHYLGDVVRARRAISHQFDPTGRISASLGPERFDEASVPPAFRGMARVLNVALARATDLKHPADLTRAEREVLAVLIRGGATRRAVAEELQKSPNTIARQTESIYRKLGVRNRSELLIRAAELGLGPAAIQSRKAPNVP